jgi:transcriptional regulator with XRE-family HTH domain
MCRHAYARWCSQQELAQRAGITQSMISMIEKGVRDMAMSVDTFWRLAWSLGTSLDALAGMPGLRG